MYKTIAQILFAGLLATAACREQRQSETVVPDMPTASTDQQKAGEAEVARRLDAANRLQTRADKIGQDWAALTAQLGERADAKITAMKADIQQALDTTKVDLDKMRAGAVEKWEAVEQELETRLTRIEERMRELRAKVG